MTATTNYDSEFCGKLPLHNVNLIQCYGYLLVLSNPDLNIIQLSENCNEVFDANINEIVTTSFPTYIENSELTVLNTGLSKTLKEKVPITLTIREREYLALLHVKTDYLILELEKVESNNKAYFLDKYQQIKFAMAAINNAATLQQVYDISLKELKAFSGFDRMLMYQFDEDWNGTVVAETVTEGLDPYLGLKFPASDIPKQARELYHRNPYRLIPDRDFKPVKLYPVLNTATQSFTDLSDCNLRSVPAVHIEYLKNMNVAASMSTRIIKNNKLWGLISCHHRSAKFLNYEECAVFELLSEVISAKITFITTEAEFTKSGKIQNDYARIIENIFSEQDLVKGLNGKEVNFKNIIHADGMAIFFKGRKSFAGIIPGEDHIDELVMWLQGKEINHTFHLDKLTSAYEGGEEFVKEGSGLLVIPIDTERGDYIIAFRQEKKHSVSWGGNPNERIQFEPDGKNYHPRNSFSIWNENVKGTSLSWEESEIAIAETLREFIFEYLHK